MEKVLRQLPDLDTSEQGYIRAREVYQESGREIQDATVDGKLTAYPKIDFRVSSRPKMVSQPRVTMVTPSYNQAAFWSRPLLGVKPVIMRISNTSL